MKIPTACQASVLSGPGQQLLLSTLVYTKSFDFTTHSMYLPYLRVLNDNGMTIFLYELQEEEPGLPPHHHPLLDEKDGFLVVSL